MGRRLELGGISARKTRQRSDSRRADGLQSYTLLCRGTNGIAYCKRWDGTTWSPGGTDWESFGEKITDPPTGVACGSSGVHVFARGEDGTVWQKRLEWLRLGAERRRLGVDWRVDPGDGLRPRRAPTRFACWPWARTTTSIRSTGMAQWLPSSTGWDYLGGGVTDPPSAVCTRTNGRLCVTRSGDGIRFDDKTVLGETTRSRPCLYANASGAWLAWTAPEDQSLNLLTSSDGTTWTNKDTFEGVTCHDAPALTSWNGHLVWSWTGTEQEHRMNVSTTGSPTPTDPPVPIIAPASAIDHRACAAGDGYGLRRTEQPRRTFATAPPLPAGVTIEFWALGAEDLPRATSIFAAWRADATRVLNIHLPWSNGAVYWDAGSEGAAFDRIENAAEPEEYTGTWAHWAFVKDVAKGEMAIYRGGVLWHKGEERFRPITEGSLAIIGAYAEGNYKWSGRLAEFRIWDKATHRCRDRR